MTPETNKNTENSHKIVRRFMQGEIPLDEYAKLFEQSHKGIDLIQMLSKRDQNEIYNECPSLRPKDNKNTGRCSLEAILDNCEDKKNQIINKVVESLKELSFLEKK